MNESYLHEINSKRFKVLDWHGKEDKGTIIGIHGLTGNHKHLAMLAEQFSPEYRFISYDIRGRGDSSSAEKPSSIKMHAEDLISIIESLDIGSPILMGHSLGAFIAAATASIYKPTKAIVLLDGAGVTTEKTKEKIEPALNRLEKEHTSKEAYIESVKPNYELMGLTWNKYIEACAEYEIENTGSNTFKFKGSIETIMQDLNSAIQFEHEEILTKITCPALLVKANGKFGETPLYDEESFRKNKVYTKDLMYLESECNHYTIAMEPQPNLVNQIQEFLNRV